MAQYAILIYGKAPADFTDLTLEERQANDRHAEELERSGAMVAAFALRPSTTATSIRGDAITDGPFLEAKEVVAGFCVIEATDLDTALDIARGNPANWQGGGVEVRPVAGGTVVGQRAEG